MRIKNLLLLVGASAAFSIGCGDDGIGGSASTGVTGSTGATGSASTGSGGMGGGFTYVAPPVAAACASPTVKAAEEIQAPAGEHYASVELAWSGDGAAIAYAVSEAMGTSWSVQFQRLKVDGTLDGAAIPIATGLMGQIGPTITLAMTKNEAIVCHDHAGSGTEIACVQIVGATKTAGYSAPGSTPSIAVGAAGYGLVYGSGMQFSSILLATNGSGVGEAHEVANSTGPDEATPVLASTEGGYAALSIGFGGILWRFSDKFEELEGNTLPGWKNERTRIVGSGSFLGAVFPDSNQVSFKRVDEMNTASAPVKIDSPNAQPIYSQTAIARGDAGTFAAVWSTIEGTMGYRGIDASGAPMGVAIDVLNVNWDDNPVAITGVSDGFIAASAANIALDDLMITHLGCM